MTASDHNALSIFAQGGVSVTALAFFSDSIMKAVPWLICAVPLIFLDLIWGIKAARYRGESIRFSKGFRRTFGKMVEYLCWIILASTLSLAFERQWIEWGVLAVVIVNELASVIGNYFETKGLQVSWKSVINAAIRFLGKKTNTDVEGIDIGDFVKPIERPRDAKGRFVKRSR